MALSGNQITRVAAGGPGLSYAVFVAKGGSVAFTTQLQSYEVDFHDFTIELTGEITVTTQLQAYQVDFHNMTISISDVWTDKISVSTTWSDQSTVNTIWTDK